MIRSEQCGQRLGGGKMTEPDGKTAHLVWVQQRARAGSTRREKAGREDWDRSRGGAECLSKELRFESAHSGEQALIHQAKF